MTSQDYIPTDIKGLVRDKSSRAVINTNKNDYLLYKSKRVREDVINGVIADIESLKKDMGEIKTLLSLFLKVAN